MSHFHPPTPTRVCDAQKSISNMSCGLGEILGENYHLVI